MSFLRRSVQLLCQVVKQRLRQWTKPDKHTPALNVLIDLTRSQSELVLRTWKVSSRPFSFPQPNPNQNKCLPNQSTIDAA